MDFMPLDMSSDGTLTELADASPRNLGDTQNIEGGITDQSLSFMLSWKAARLMAGRAVGNNIFHNPQITNSVCPASNIHASIIPWL